MLEWIKENWELIIAIVGVGGVLDAIAGFLPDRFVPYIGLVRRIVDILARTPGGRANLALIALALLANCGTLGIGKPPSICDDLAPGNSVLCDLAARADINLEVMGDLIMVVNLRAIKEGAYTAADAQRALQGIRDAVSATNVLAAAELRALALRYISDFPELLLISRYIYVIDSPRILTARDRAMIISWCDQQLSLL
ncbi:MAG TPA: hypothetical protein VJ019_05475 [Aestuariivirga sp.]|nr:hypothetical protein [Aestuariivirga sp.]